ncbi:MAG: sugar transferase [Bacteroidota bacterium]
MHRRTTGERHIVVSVLKRNWRAAAVAAAILADVCIVSVAFVCAGLLAHPSGGPGAFLEAHALFLLVAVVVYLVSFAALGLYRVIASVNVGRHFLLAAKGYLLGCITLVCFLFLVREVSYSRAFLAAFFGLLPALYFVGWSELRLLRERLARHRLGRWKTLVIGFDRTIHRLLQRINACPELGYDVVRVIPTEGAEGELLRVEQAAVEEAVAAHGVEQIVLSSSHLNGSFDRLERLCRRYDIRMSIVSEETDFLFTRTTIHDIAGIPVVVPPRGRLDGLKRVLKRTFDLVVSGAALVVFSPLFLLVAAATRLESRGPVFFKQMRALSDDDTPFLFYKFRSMVHEADEARESLVDRNESNGALFKIRNDPRRTRVGRFLRRHSIDELPQLINVFRGNMSLVGPRPLPVRDFRRLEERDHLGGYFRMRRHARPGMTGLWQVSGRSELGFREMVLLDLYYLEHQTLLFDLEILVQTIPVVLFGRGAY